MGMLIHRRGATKSEKKTTLVSVAPAEKKVETEKSEKKSKKQ